MPVGDLIRTNAVDPARATRAFLLFNETRITFAEYYAESIRWANLLLHLRHSCPQALTPPGLPAPFHVGVLLDNTPDYFYALGGAALAGATVVGINNTKRGAFLARDIAYTDCQILVTEGKYLPILNPVRDATGVAPERILITQRWDDAGTAGPPTPDASDQGYRDLDAAVAQFGNGADPFAAVADAAPYILVFTSGTVTAPKAVQCSHGRMLETGKNIGANVYALTPTDVGYIAMPLFHANALMCGFLPAITYGVGLGLIRKFSKRRWLSDVRRYGATFFNYTGKPLAYILSTPRLPDDHVNPLRICYGNEGSHTVVAEFEARFGCRVIDVFGSTEGGVGVTRQSGDPPGCIGFPAPGIIVVDAHGAERPPAHFDESGRLLDAGACVGEIVNTQGLGWFEGYYKNPEAMQQRTHDGWYWTGDLGYKDARGYLYFAGRDIEWLRVDGENFVARPIEEILHRHPDVILAAVYGVPDPDGGDRVMAALILREGAVFDPAALAAFLRAQPDLSPKWIPSYVRISRELPQTATAKILKNELRRQKFRSDLCSDPVYWRSRSDEEFQRFTAEDHQRLRERFAAVGRQALLEI